MKKISLKHVLNKIAAQTVDNPDREYGTPGDDDGFSPIVMGSCCHSPRQAQETGVGCSNNVPYEACDGNWQSKKKCDERDCDIEVFDGVIRGACCVGNNCQFVTEEECAALDGSYSGDYIRCDDGDTANRCLSSDVKGACCYFDINGSGYSCETTSYEECKDKLTGTWAGANTFCKGDSSVGNDPRAVDCEESRNKTGACCEHVPGQDNTECSENTTELNCMAGGGSFLGEDSTCEGANCREELKGSCCIKLYLFATDSAGNGINQDRYECIQTTRDVCDSLAEPVRLYQPPRNFQGNPNDFPYGSYEGVFTIFSGAGTECEDSQCEDIWEPKRPCCYRYPVSRRFPDNQKYQRWSCSLKTQEECQAIEDDDYDQWWERTREDLERWRRENPTWERDNGIRLQANTAESVWHGESENCASVDCNGDGGEQSEDGGYSPGWGLEASIKSAELKLRESLKTIKKKS